MGMMTYLTSNFFGTDFVAYDDEQMILRENCCVERFCEMGFFGIITCDMNRPISSTPKR